MSWHHEKLYKFYKSYITKKEIIFEYNKWVLEVAPEIGLALFLKGKCNYQINLELYKKLPVLIAVGLILPVKFIAVHNQ